MLDLNASVRSLALRELADWMPFEMTDGVATILDVDLRNLAVKSRYDFERVLQRMHVLFVERGPGRRRSGRVQWPAVLGGVYTALEAPANRVNNLRQVYFHDKTTGGGEHQKALESAAIATQHYVGRSTIPELDRAGWSQLAWAMLDDVVTSTQTAATIARDELDRRGVAQTTAPEEQHPLRPGDLDTVLDLRIRA